jgi:hypothetical protein
MIEQDYPQKNSKKRNKNFLQLGRSKTPPGRPKWGKNTIFALESQNAETPASAFLFF